MQFIKKLILFIIIIIFSSCEGTTNTQYVIVDKNNKQYFTNEYRFSEDSCLQFTDLSACSCSDKKLIIICDKGYHILTNQNYKSNDK